MARRRARMGQVLDRMPPSPPKGNEPGGDWQADLAGGARPSASKRLLRSGWNKGERRGFGVASGRTEPPEPVPTDA